MEIKNINISTGNVEQEKIPKGINVNNPHYNWGE